MNKIRNVKIIYNHHFLLTDEKVWRYTQNGVVTEVFSEDELLAQSVIVNNLIHDGFEKMEVYVNKRFVDVPIDFKYIGNQDKKMDIVFKKSVVKLNVLESYRLTIAVEIKGREIDTFYIPGKDPSIRFVNYSQEREYPAFMTKEKEQLFGKPLDLELGSIFWEYPIWKTSKEYRQPFSAIDKIIGIKKFYNTDAIGEKNEVAKTHFTGEEERIVLDLHNFDENIYNIFKAHNNSVEIEWD